MSVLRIRRLNTEGVRRMTDFLESQTTAAPQQYDDARSLLTDRETSEGFSGVAEIDQRQTFPRRFDLAAHLHDRVPRLNHADPTRDAGLWAWLALAWFEHLCPRDKGGSWRPGEQYRYIPELDNFQTYYRHRVLGPYLIYGAHRDNPERAMCMLCQPPPIHPDTAEQLASRQDLVQSPALIGTATRLYYDPTTHGVRKGSTTYKDKQAKPGTLRRLVDVCWQLDRTYDHLACTVDAFMTLLPAEFARFASTGQPR